MDYLEKQEGTSSTLRQALCFISNPSVNSNWNYSRKTLNSGRNLWYFVLCDLEIWWPWKAIGHLFYTTSSFVHHFKSIGEVKLELKSGNSQFGSKFVGFFYPTWPWNLTNDLENNRAPFLYYIKLCASFQSHGWIQTGASPDTFNWGQNRRFVSRVTLTFDVWTWKSIGHLSYDASTFVHHFTAIGKLKLELQSGNAQFGSKSIIFFAVWPWNLTDDLEKQ